MTALEGHDAEVRVVPRFDRRTPASNKLRMLELAASHEFDVLLAIDTDTLVLGDVGRYADRDRVAIKPENRDPYPAACWRELFAVLGIPEPSPSVVTTSTAQVTYPYYNSGVVFVPRAQCAPPARELDRRACSTCSTSTRDGPTSCRPGSATGRTSSPWPSPSSATTSP